MLGNSFGEIKSAGVNRTANTQEITNCVGGLAAYLMNNPRFELTLQARFDADVTAPGLGELIQFPFPAVYGRVLSPSVEWSESGVRMLSIEATHWDSLADAHLYTWDGSAMTEVDTGPPA
jgi:hypothetical protein